MASYLLDTSVIVDAIHGKEKSSFLGSLGYCEVTRGIARSAGRLRYDGVCRPNPLPRRMRLWLRQLWRTACC
jgi:hypothetical protein